MRSRAPILPSKIDDWYVDVPPALRGGVGDPGLVYEAGLQLEYVFNRNANARLSRRAVGLQVEDDADNEPDFVKADRILARGLRL